MPSFEITCGKSFISENVSEIIIFAASDGLKARIMRKDGTETTVVPWDPRDSILVERLGIEVSLSGY